MLYAPLAGEMGTDATSNWFWEGNVVETLAGFLLAQGWAVVSKADTHSKARGVDIHAEKSGKILLIEVKGFPSTGYRDPRRAGEPKPTNPNNQAQQWYSHAILKAMRLRNKHPEAQIALAFPNFPRYRALFEETRDGLQSLCIGNFWIEESGEIRFEGSSFY